MNLQPKANEKFNVAKAENPALENISIPVEETSKNVSTFSISQSWNPPITNVQKLINKKGQQELIMPFLSNASNRWMTSLRDVEISPQSEERSVSPISTKVGEMVRGKFLSKIKPKTEDIKNWDSQINLQPKANERFTVAKAENLALENISIQGEETSKNLSTFSKSQSWNPPITNIQKLINKKGQQELIMPFLSNASNRWMTSLRDVEISPQSEERSVSPQRKKINTKVDKMVREKFLSKIKTEVEGFKNCENQMNLKTNANESFNVTVEETSKNVSTFPVSQSGNPPISNVQKLINKKGQQELIMPFLSNASNKWMTSLRDSEISPKTEEWSVSPQKKKINTKVDKLVREKFLSKIKAEVEGNL